jgi:5'-deoxynucleotidase YfbR-like HD superfamily hydrolase
MSRYAICDGSLVDIETMNFNVGIDIIAHHLAKINRFNGALPLDVNYSVAEHCLNLCDYFLEHTQTREKLEQKQLDYKKVALLALLHDASEAYVGDMVSPLKAFCPDYQRIETRVYGEILSELWPHCSINDEFAKTTELVHKADKQILLDEVACIIPNKLEIYQKELPKTKALQWRIYYNYKPSYVKNLYIKRYKELTSF